MNNEKYVLVLDTETTGLPKDYNASPENSGAWPHVTQLAFATFDLSGNLLEKHCYLIKPKGWTIPNEKFFIDNNMSTERCEAEGVEIEYAMGIPTELRRNAAYTVAHNMSFDAKILRAEMFRIGDRTEFEGTKICTKTKTTKFCALPSSRGYKWPTLGELHNKLFGCDFDGAHDALNDVMACAKCFFECVNRGIIFLQPELEKISLKDEFKDM